LCAIHALTLHFAASQSARDLSREKGDEHGRHHECDPHTSQVRRQPLMHLVQRKPTDGTLKKKSKAKQALESRPNAQVHHFRRTTAQSVI